MNIALYLEYFENDCGAFLAAQCSPNWEVVAIQALVIATSLPTLNHLYEEDRIVGRKTSISKESESIGFLKPELSQSES